MDEKFQKEEFGQYIISKVPCPNCDDVSTNTYNIWIRNCNISLFLIKYKSSTITFNSNDV